MYKGYSKLYPKTMSFTEAKAWSVLSQTEIVEFIPKSAADVNPIY